MVVPGENPAGTGGQGPPNPAGDTPPAALQTELFDGQPFDAARAQRTILEQRESERALRESERQLKERVKELEPLAQATRERQDNERTEVERATARATQAEQERDRERESLRQTRIGFAVESAARSAGVVEEAIARGTIARLVDVSKIEIDPESGRVTGADKAVEELLKAEPHFKAAPATTTQTTTAGIPPAPRNAPANETREQRQERLYQDMRRGPVPRA